MAQSLIAFYCFNDNDTSLVHDFSVNEHHSTSETDLTITTNEGAVGKVGVFNGTTTYVDFGHIGAFDNVTGFSCVVKFKIDALPASNAYLSHINSLLDIFYTSTGAIRFYIYDSSANIYQLQYNAGLVINTWYTLVFTWDGENMNFYNGTSTTAATQGAAFANMDTVADELTIGGSNGGGLYFDGQIEMISFYSKALITDEINAIMESPTGIQYEAGDGMIQTGDLVYNNSGGKEVCTWYEEFDEMEFADNEEQLFSDGELQMFKN